MKKRLLTGLGWLVVLWCLAPFVWQIITSLKTESEIASIPPVYVPSEPTLHHYTVLFERKPFARYLLNSFVVSTGATALCLAVSALAAYSMARVHVRGAKWMRGTLVAVSFFPPIIFFFPLYEMIRATHTANTPFALILPYAAFNLPFGILVLSAFFRAIPGEIEDAAKVDGFSRMQVLWKIILPLSAPALATTGILVFIFSWNEFLYALTFMTRDTARTVTAGIASLSGGTPYELPWGAISASVVLSTLPLLALVMIFQRRIIQGLTAGATKG
jgi:multiple sugar transport system permease protein